ncbi:YbaY family lipoprotein [Pelagibius sp. CAU 1746]|uniref:YbaY family lipoprotein n=1 Tax=Pelagibius sp. CAU 1746 TaxID=3140370 RepID=UPI00325ADAB3
MTPRDPGVLALICLLLGACAADPGQPTAKAQTTVTGALTYRERIALPPGATARITLSDVSIADRAAPLLAEQSIDLSGQQVPIDFTLDLSRSDLDPRGRYAVRGSVLDARGRLLWTTDTTHLIDPAQSANHLGPLMLVPTAAAEDAAAADRLRGAEWRVEDIGRRGIVDFSRVSMTFGGDGRITGLTGCNSYSLTYRISGGRLSIGQGANTLRACLPALDDQQRRFLRILSQVSRFEFTEDGALILSTPEGEALTARR